jgi:hypothetical protein
MSGAHINWTDGAGAAQLDNGLTASAGGVGSQFKNWVSDSNPVGPEVNALGTGALTKFVFRTDYTASFDLTDIPNANTTLIDRLIAWLRAGGTVSVTCGDTTSAVYATCCLAPGAKIAKKMDNKNDITWTVSLSLLNIAASPVPMTCIYAS